jgi:hypothetical protein
MVQASSLGLAKTNLNQRHFSLIGCSVRLLIELSSLGGRGLRSLIRSSMQPSATFQPNDD